MIITAALLLIEHIISDPSAANQFYMKQLVMLNGLSSSVVMVFMIFLYKKDFFSRKYCGILTREGKMKQNIPNLILFLFLGTSLSFIVNIAVNLFAAFMGIDTYDAALNLITEGKSIWELIFWIGILGPVCEEMVFRWMVFLRLRDYMSLYPAAIISGLLFGIYHGNLIQFIYATILGIYFALALEWTGSLLTSVLLHMSANIWSLLFNEYQVQLLGRLSAGGILLAMMIFCLDIIVMTCFLYRAGSIKKQRNL